MFEKAVKSEGSQMRVIGSGRRRGYSEREAEMVILDDNSFQERQRS